MGFDWVFGRKIWVFGEINLGFCSNFDLATLIHHQFNQFISGMGMGRTCSVKFGDSYNKTVFKLNQRGWIYTRAFSLNRPYANQGSRPSLICLQISWYTERTVGVYLFCIYVLCIAIILKPKLCLFSSFECFFEIYDLENPQFRIQ